MPFHVNSFRLQCMEASAKAAKLVSSTEAQKCSFLLGPISQLFAE